MMQGALFVIALALSSSYIGAYSLPPSSLMPQLFDSTGMIRIARPNHGVIEFQLVPRESVEGNRSYFITEQVRKGVVTYDIVTDSIRWVYKKIINGSFPAFSNRESLTQLTMGSDYYDIDFAVFNDVVVACFHIKPAAINDLLVGAKEVGYRNSDGYVAYELLDGSIGYFMHRTASVYQGFWFESMASFVLYHDKVFNPR